MPESPASVGVPGPGEMMIRSMIFSSRRNKTSAIDAASLRSVRGGARVSSHAAMTCARMVEYES